MIYAVIDTNVLVSALFTSNIESSTVKVVKALFEGLIVPLYNREIFDEYVDVLNRPKFHFSQANINNFLKEIEARGISSERVSSNDFFPDSEDVVFYEVAMSRKDAFLVTGNQKHFPKSPIVVTPEDMVEILKLHHLL